MITETGDRAITPTAVSSKEVRNHPAAQKHMKISRHSRKVSPMLCVSSFLSLPPRSPLGLRGVRCCFLYFGRVGALALLSVAVMVMWGPLWRLDHTPVLLLCVRFPCLRLRTSAPLRKASHKLQDSCVLQLSQVPQSGSCSLLFWGTIVESSVVRKCYVW